MSGAASAPAETKPAISKITTKDVSMSAGYGPSLSIHDPIIPRASFTDDGHQVPDTLPGKIYRYCSSLVIVQRTFETLSVNAGLLLIGAAQWFFSLMNASVKQLNSLDVPVPALEVSV